MSSVRFDHVIYAVPDLKAAAARFSDQYGLGSVEGGRHPGWGTANRIVPLGHDYVELVTVVDPAEAATSDFGRPVMEALASGDRLVGWAARTDDLQSIASRLSLQVTPGFRTRPDGSTLAWKLAGIAQSLATAAMPFFIEWNVPPELHPGAAPAEHRVTPSGIAWIEVTASTESLRSWLGDNDLALRITEGAPSLSAVAISTTEGEFVLR
ncbi:MAG: VOC family protein [Solirubrobacteraceae bacterium]